MKDKIKINKALFSEVIDALDSKEIVEYFKIDDDIIIAFDANKMIGIIEDIGSDIVISKNEFEQVDSNEAKSLLLLLNKPRIAGLRSISIEEVACKLFIIENFYNLLSPRVVKDNIIISVDEEFKIILESLVNIDNVVNKKYTLDFIVKNKGNEVELKLIEPYIDMLKYIRRNKR